MSKEDQMDEFTELPPESGGPSLLQKPKRMLRNISVGVIALVVFSATYQVFWSGDSKKASTPQESAPESASILPEAQTGMFEDKVAQARIQSVIDQEKEQDLLDKAETGAGVIMLADEEMAQQTPTAPPPIIYPEETYPGPIGSAQAAPAPENKVYFDTAGNPEKTDEQVLRERARQAALQKRHVLEQQQANAAMMAISSAAQGLTSTWGSSSAQAWSGSQPDSTQPPAQAQPEALYPDAPPEIRESLMAQNQSPEPSAEPMTPESNASADAESPGDTERPDRPVKKKTLAMPGDLHLAYLDTMIDSDVKSIFVTTTIMSGPLKGARLIGQHVFEGECLIVNYNSMQFKGEIHEIRAQAADLENNMACLKGYVNRRLFQRYGVPLIFSIAGAGVEFMKRKNTETYTVTDETGEERVVEKQASDQSFDEVAAEVGAEEAMRNFQPLVQQSMSTPIQVVKKSSPIGVRWLTQVQIEGPSRRIYE